MRVHKLVSFSFFRELERLATVFQYPQMNKELALCSRLTGISELALLATAVRVTDACNPCLN